MNKRTIVILFIIIAVIIIGVLVIPRILDTGEEKTTEAEEEYKILNGGIYEETDVLNESGLTANINKINNICNKYLSGSNIYFAMIPNKEYYLNNDMGSSNEFFEIEGFIKPKLNQEISYIELYDTLNLDCYYKTDMHWKQEDISGVVEKISQAMNLKDENNASNDENEYEEKSLGDFYGSYYAEISNNEIQPDELKYLTNSMIENCVVYNTEKEAEEKVYNLDRVNETNNKYDLFLSGAAAIQRIDNNEINNGKKLILFRDSFGSSIAPLLIGYYEEILLVDIRYVNSEFLDNYIDFDEYENQDVLFLYNTRVINKSGIFR